MALLIIFIVISLIFIFNIQVGFSIYENIKSIDIILLLILFLVVLTIVFVIIGIIFIIYKKRKRGMK